MNETPSDSKSSDEYQLNDPSILSIDSQDASESKQKRSNKKKDVNLAESSQKNMTAIAKFLESAAAAAAEEEPSLAKKKVNLKSKKKNEEVYIAIPKRVLLHQYEPEVLIALKESPLVLEVLESLDLPAKDFWRFRSTKAMGGLPVSGSSRWNSGYHGNSLNSSTGEMGSFAIGGKGHDRKRNNHREKKKGKMDHPKVGRKYNNRDDDDKETPEWMLENDEPIGNSALDFEKWKLKMKLEEKKMNGEEITESEINLLKNTLQTSAPLEMSAKESKNSIDSFFSLYQEDSSKSINESSPSNTQKDTKLTDSNGGSRFSSFFGGGAAPAPAPPTIPVNTQGSKLLSMINGGGNTSGANKPPVVASPHGPPPGLTPQYSSTMVNGSPNENAANSLLNAVDAATSNNNAKKNTEMKNQPMDMNFLQQQQRQQPPQQQQQFPPMQGQPGQPPVSKKNDVFFLSLLTKAGENGNQQGGPMPPQFMNGMPPQFYGQGPPPPWLMQNGVPPPPFVNDQQRFPPQQFPGNQKMQYPPMMNGPPPGFPVMYQHQQPDQQILPGQFNQRGPIPLPPFLQQQQQQQPQQPQQQQQQQQQRSEPQQQPINPNQH